MIRYACSCLETQDSAQSAKSYADTCAELQVPARSQIERRQDGKESDMAEFRERKRWVFLGLPFTFTKYTVKEDMITVNTGLLRTEENDCYMYKVQDVKHTATLLEKMFGLGTVICFTGDTTDPQLQIAHIKNSKAVKDFILQASEEARMKRRTMNMLNIGAGDMEDADPADF